MKLEKYNRPFLFYGVAVFVGNKIIKEINMNKREVIIRVSEKSGVDIEVCEKVLAAFEEVLGEGLAAKLKFWKKDDTITHGT
jgi:hypothetical protein